MTPTKDCADCGPQMIWDFYVNHHNGDDLSTYCKACTKRRSAIAQTKRRDKRRNQGMPVSDKPYNAHLSHGNGYLDRHLQRREQEALNCLSNSADEVESSFPAEPKPVWAGMMDSWMRQPQRISNWKIL